MNTTDTILCETFQFSSDHDPDFWSKLYEWHYTKVFSAITGFICIVTMPNIAFGTINYNQNRHIKTILNYLENAVCVSGAGALTQIYILEEMRYFIGPLPTFLCWYLAFIRNAPIVAMSLFLDSIAIFRYIYIFVWKAFAPIDDKYFAIFLYILIPLWSLIYGIFYMVIPGKHGINYYMCTGENPANDTYDFKKFPINAILPVASMVVYLVTTFKVARKRSKFNQFPEAPNNTGCFATIKIPKSAISITSTVLISICAVLESIAWNSVTNHMTPQQIMNDTFATIAVYWHNNFGPALYFAITLITAMIRQKELMKYLKNLFCGITSSTIEVVPIPTFKKY